MVLLPIMTQFLLMGVWLVTSLVSLFFTSIVPLGVCAITMVKLWTTFNGLKLAFDHGFRAILTESDQRLLFN